MLTDEAKTETFTEFFTDVEPRLHAALIGSLGLDKAREATAEALAYGWEHWDRLREMDNPAGYLYRVARTKARKLYGRRLPPLPPAPADEMPWIEPALPLALVRLSERQRVVVLLVHGFGWSQAEVADLLGLTHGAVQKHSARGLEKLRAALGGDS